MRRRSDYHYDLSPDQIAQTPAAHRDESRLLVLGPGGLDDQRFRDIVERIPAGSVLVVNDTRVVPARLHTVKPTGGAVELLFLEGLKPVSVAGGPGERWRCMARSSKPLRLGTHLAVVDRAGQPTGQPTGETVVVASDRAADATVSIDVPGEAFALLERRGEVPLPPYITRPEGATAVDSERYQTVYARAPGAAAAPTAGLHFTDDILAALRRRGCDIASITLHVGLGTFAPMRVDDIDEHRMHLERYYIPEATAKLVSTGRPVVAVGTTCVRALESASASASASAAAAAQPDTPGKVATGWASTRLFITPGYRFQIVDWLVTNFHLPESTLLMLVTAFGGYERVMAAYRHAAAAGYRFFSYGDAMLISRQRFEDLP